MVTAADSHISGADTITTRESDSHVTNAHAQLDAIGDKPTCGETTAMPPTCETDTAAHTDMEVTGEANTSALNEGTWVSPRSKNALSKGKKAKQPKPGPVVAQGLSSVYLNDTDRGGLQGSSLCEQDHQGQTMLQVPRIRPYLRPM